jgi:hypothetical protein
MAARVSMVPFLLLAAAFVSMVPGGKLQARNAAAPKVAAPTNVGPGMPDEPLGGQPPAGSASSVTDFDYRIKYHRAFEAMLWRVRATWIYSFRFPAMANVPNSEFIRAVAVAP